MPTNMSIFMNASDNMVLSTELRIFILLASLTLMFILFQKIRYSIKSAKYITYIVIMVKYNIPD